MSRRGSSLAILVLAVSLPVTAEANCGCEAAGRPCTEEVLATAALPAPEAAPVMTSEEMDFSITACWDCGGATNPLPFLLWGLLFSLTIAVKRVVCGPDRLIVLRLTIHRPLECPGGLPAGPGRDSR
jgi:hypothetical protein